MKNAPTNPLDYWPTSPELWVKLKPLAREKRKKPTEAERRLWQRLRKKQLGFKFRRQHVIERFIVDFYCRPAQLVIEVDGPIHQYTMAEDGVRQEYLESLGLRVLRFTNDEVLNTEDDVVERIAAVLKDVTPPPAPPRFGEGS